MGNKQDAVQTRPHTHSRIDGIDGQAQHKGSRSRINRSGMKSSRNRHSRLRSSNLNKSHKSVNQSRLIYQSTGLSRVKEDPQNLTGFKAINLKQQKQEPRDREVDYNIQDTRTKKSTSSIKDKMTFKLDDEGGIAHTTPVPTFNYSQSSLSHDFWAYNRSDMNYIQSKAGRDDKNTLASRIRENKNENIDTQQYHSGFVRNNSYQQSKQQQQKQKTSFFGSLFKKDKKQEQYNNEQPQQKQKTSFFGSLFKKDNNQERVLSDKNSEQRPHDYA